MVLLIAAQRCVWSALAMVVQVECTAHEGVLKIVGVYQL